MSDSKSMGVISADSHVMEPVDMWEKPLYAKFGDDTPRVIKNFMGRSGTWFHTGGQVMNYGGSDTSSQQIGMQAAGWDPKVRVEFQKKADIACEVLNGTFMLLIMRHPNYACLRACCEVFNTWLGAFIAHDRTRLRGVGMLAMDDLAWSLKEVERCKKLGFDCVNIHLYAPPGQPPYRKAHWDPFWAKCQELEMPVQLHIITGRVPDPIHFHTPAEQGDSPRTQLAMMYEVMGVLANDFIFGGILDRFPTLKVICSEFEISWIPNFMWRLDHMQDAMSVRLPLPKLKEKASDYMRTRVWHGMIDDAFGAETIPEIGFDRILWGSDFPHVRSIGLDARPRLKKMFASFSEADRQRIVAGNAAHVFNIH
ncbi:MAG: amidohydrolase [Alphaproteobacteria bacterium]|nr:amidohydrolase [Alphaproteobacteria bacterium]